MLPFFSNYLRAFGPLISSTFDFRFNKYIIGPVNNIVTGFVQYAQITKDVNKRDSIIPCIESPICVYYHAHHFPSTETMPYGLEETSSTTHTELATKDKTHITAVNIRNLFTINSDGSSICKTFTCIETTVIVSAPEKAKAEIVNPSPLKEVENIPYIHIENAPGADLKVSQYFTSKVINDASKVAKIILDVAMEAAAKSKAVGEALQKAEAEAKEKTPTVAEIEAYLKHLKQVASRKPKK